MAKKKAAKKKATKPRAAKKTSAAGSATVRVSAPNDRGIVRINVSAGKRKLEGQIHASNQLAVFSEIGRLVCDAMGRL